MTTKETPQEKNERILSEIDCLSAEMEDILLDKIPNHTESQNKRILEHLSLGRTITSLEALSLFGSLRLAARISDLRNAGNTIITDMVQVGNTKKKVAKYRLYIS